MIYIIEYLFTNRITIQKKRMKQNHIALIAESATKQIEAKQLANQLHLDYLDDFQSSSHYDFLLILTDQHLGLQKVGEAIDSLFFIDFDSGKMRYRYQQASLRKEWIAKAVGINPKESPSIIDATAGLGRDSFILAALGYHVLMLEKSPILYALLQDGLRRAKSNDDLNSIVERLELIHTDSIVWLNQLHNDARPDIIFLDPMFPPRKKTAAVKKEMQILHQIIDDNDDDDVLFTAALACTKRRLVVKRPRFAPYYSRCKPNFSLLGKSSRFDIYLKATS
jgi:16S rRNA (guanine1516-N2)-methyltransferase